MAQVIDAGITDVIDDTVRVRSYGARSNTIRLLGIDTPETRNPRVPRECGGGEATANLLGLSFSDPQDSDGDGLLDRKGGEGARVTQTTDPTQDLLDSFGRLFAYVETADGEQLEREQLRAGLAEVFVFERPFRRLRRFQ